MPRSERIGMSLTAGTRLGRYEIVALLGAGGMGEVYRARDELLGREVAIKIISDGKARDDQSRQCFEAEAKAVAALSHPNILAIHDFHSEGEILFAVMELLEGESLDDRLAREQLPWRNALEIAAAVADGLASAHARGIVHRDLKPANVFLTTDGQVKILDFGLARHPPLAGEETSTETQSQPNMVVGTVGYMSPEQVTGAPVDGRSDLFAAGCILFEMITGERAFRRSSAGETLVAILRDSPGELSQSGRPFPSAIASIVRRCLQKDRNERFQTARDLSFALNEVLAASDKPASRPLDPAIRWAPATLVVVALIAMTAWFATSRAPRLRKSGVHSIAVLPIANLSGDPAQEYVADGLTGELISDLARLRDLRVTSQTSSMSYKGVRKALPQIARELGVDAVLEGSVVRRGARIRILTELVDAHSEKHLWSESYDRDSNALGSLHHDIARAVAQNLDVEMTPEIRRRFDGKRSVDPVSFDAYIRGQYAFNKGGRDDLFRAVEQFQRALDADPTNAPAYAGLAETYALIGYWNYRSPADSFPKARAAAQRALLIDADSAEAHGALGYIELYYDWNFAAAEAEFQKAIALNPNLASAHRYYAIYLAAMLRPTESQSEAARARILDPFSVPVVTDSGFVMYYDRHYDKAAKVLTEAMGINPKAAGPHFWLGRVYQAERHYDQAAAEYKIAEPGMSKVPAIYAALGHMYGLTGKRAEALRVLQEIEAMSKKTYVTPYAAALIYLGLGEKEQALSFLDRCLAERTNWLVWLLKDPRWDPMRSEPRFLDIVRKVGFPPDARARASQQI